MRVFILTLGTRGDFELFLMLARVLRQRGHGVVLGTSGFYAGKTRDSGIEWAHIGQGTQEELVSILRSLAAVRDREGRTRLHAARWLRPQLAVARDTITSIGAEADYFISNLKMALRRGGHIVPGAFVTYDPPGAVEDLPRYGSQQHDGMILELVAMNKQLVDPEGLWGERYRFTGFWRDEQPAAWDPPRSLTGFLEQGPPPVVVTMGSMVMFDTREFLGKMGQALRLSGRRGIIVAGWSGITDAEVPRETLHLVSEAPYDWLFPRAACVIHHGGCGTVAAVLRAGKASILFPQISCQERFGRMLAREHLATGMFDAHAFNPGDLAAAMTQAVADEQVLHGLRRWKTALSEERGVQVAAQGIDAHWSCLQARGIP